MNPPEQITEMLRAHEEKLDAIRRAGLRNIRDSVMGLDKHVPLFNGGQVRYVNLDNAATTPPFAPVFDCCRRFFELYGSVHRGSGFKSLVSTRVYEHCRERVAQFVGADGSHHAVLFTPNATHALNKIARHVRAPADGVILTTIMEHHSNMLPWRRTGCRIAYARVNREDGSLDVDDLERRMRAAGGKLVLVAVTAASNVTGNIPPIRRIARLAHEHGAMIVVDATQIVPHRPLQMGAPDDPERLDFAAFSGHKMYAPFGAGVLVGPRSFFDSGDPDVVGGGTIEAVTEESVVWAPLPEKEEAGTPNVVGAVALACASGVLATIGLDNVAEHERELTRRALRGLSRIKGLTVHGSSDPDAREDRLGVIALNADGMSHGQLACALSHEWGIGARNGCFCAQPYVRELLGVTAEQMNAIMGRLASGDHATVPGMVRVSFGLYNTAEEVDYLLEALRAIISDGPRAKYAINERYGDYMPDPPVVSPDDYIPF